MSPAAAVTGSRAGGPRDHQLEIAGQRARLGDDREARRRVRDGGVDLRSVPDDAGVGHEASPIAIVEGSDEPRIEALERGAERLALVEDGRPRQAGLERLEGEALEELGIVGGRARPTRRRGRRASPDRAADRRSPTSIAAGPAVHRLRDRREVEQGAVHRWVGRWLVGVEDRSEDIARDRLRAARADQDDRDESAGDPTIREVE